MEEKHTIVQNGIAREDTWIPTGPMDIYINATVNIDEKEGSIASGQLVGKNMEKMPLHVKVKSKVPITLFIFPLPIYFYWEDISHFQCNRPGMLPIKEKGRYYGQYNTTGYYLPNKEDVPPYNDKTLPRATNYVCGMSKVKREKKSLLIKNKTKTTLQSVGILNTKKERENMTLQIEMVRR